MRDRRKKHGLFLHIERSQSEGYGDVQVQPCKRFMAITPCLLNPTNQHTRRFVQQDATISGLTKPVLVTSSARILPW
jgi:hypothetical protein